MEILKKKLNLFTNSLYTPAIDMSFIFAVDFANSVIKKKKSTWLLMSW